MSIRPLGDRVLVKPLKEEEITKSGIVLPDTLDKEKKTEGEIIALGEGEKLAKLNLKVGMKVLFKKGWDDDVKVEGIEYKVLDHDNVVAVIE